MSAPPSALPALLRAGRPLRPLAVDGLHDQKLMVVAARRQIDRWVSVRTARLEVGELGEAGGD